MSNFTDGQSAYSLIKTLYADWPYLIQNWFPDLETQDVQLLHLKINLTGSYEFARTYNLLILTNCTDKQLLTFRSYI